jgi:DNA invertase Pin-like site-specific DNA recombinase
MNDLRIKLTPRDKAAIVKAVSNGESIAGQARLYGVSRQWVYMILNPDKAMEHVKRRKKYDYYDREKQTAANRAYLKRKRESVLPPIE